MVTGFRASLWVFAVVSLAGCSRGGGAADPEDFALPTEETSTDTSNVAAAGSGEPTNPGASAPTGGDTSGGSIGAGANDPGGGAGSLPSDDAGAAVDANTSASMSFGGGGIPGFGTGGSSGGIPGFGTGGFNIPRLPGQDGGFSLGDGGFSFP